MDVSTGVCQQHSVAGHVPSAVLLPRTAEDVAQAVTLANQHGVRLTVRGSGTKDYLGTTGQPDAVLCTRQLNQILLYEPMDLTVSVQPGITLSELQTALAAQGQFLPLDPAGHGQATLGGLISANVSGPSRLLYGSLRDLLLGTQVVLASGDRIKTGGRVVKNVAGYDMNKLFVGAMGTLGVLTEATFKVRPLPEVKRTQLFVFPDCETVYQAADTILQSHLIPEAIAALSPRVARQAALPGPWILAISLAEARQAVEYMALELGRLLAHASDSLTLTGREEAALWEQIRNPRDVAGAHVVLKAATAIPHVATVSRIAEQVAADVGGCSLIAQVGSGILHVVLSEAEPLQLGSVIGAIQRAAEETGGTCIVEHAPTAVQNAVQVWGSPRPEWHLMRGLKQKFDPNGIFSPGRFVGGM